LTGTREGGVLGKKAVTRMDRIGARPVRRLNESVDPEITARGFTRPDVHCLIGFAHVARCPIAIGVHRNRPQPQLPTRPDDPDGDLAAIGNENFHETRQAGAGRTAIGSGI
jgi:hypothetical protein